MPLHREPRLVSMSGWSSDFAPLSSAFSSLRGTMAWLLKSHNGVHCCGTVGDSHSHSQLSTATCTSQGGLLCFRSALQRYNNIPTPPNFFEKKSAQFILAFFPARLRIVPSRPSLLGLFAPPLVHPHGASAPYRK